MIPSDSESQSVLVCACE